MILGFFDKRDQSPTECNQKRSIRQFPGHSQHLLETARVIGPAHQEKEKYLQSKTFALREEDRAIAAATPRSARQGMRL